MAPKHFTASIDAALALVERVLPGWRWTVTSVGDDKEIPKAWLWLERLWAAPEEPSLLRNYEAEAPISPLAILKSLFAALIAQEEGK
jgi:hypothetical protein